MVPGKVRHRRGFLETRQIVLATAKPEKNMFGHWLDDAGSRAFIDASLVENDCHIIILASFETFKQTKVFDR